MYSTIKYNKKIEIMTKDQEIEIVNNAIDAIMNLSDIESVKVNLHEFIHSEKSVVSKLRSIIHELEG